MWYHYDGYSNGACAARSVCYMRLLIRVKDYRSPCAIHILSRPPELWPTAATFLTQPEAVAAVTASSYGPRPRGH